MSSLIIDKLDSGYYALCVGGVEFEGTLYEAINFLNIACGLTYRESLSLILELNTDQEIDNCLTLKQPLVVKVRHGNVH